MTAELTYAERKKHELRRDIIDAAFAVFAERGYHDAGIADIATRLGIGHGTVYRYFKNKRDILDHVMNGLMERAMEALAAENAPEATSSLAEYRAQCERIADALFALFNEDPQALRLLLLQSGAVDSELEQRLMGLLQTSALLITAYLDNGRDRGFLRADLDTTATGEAILGLIVSGTLFALQHNGDRTHQKAYKHAAIALMFDGVSA